MILRGGTRGPNYAEPSIDEVTEALASAKLSKKVMVDCSHANSGKDHLVQPQVVHDVADQVGAGSQGIFGVMLESFLKDGNQKHSQDAGASGLVYGQSITEACMSWERTEPLLAELADTVRRRRG